MGLLSKARKSVLAVTRGDVNAGYCAACGRRTVFAIRGPVLRDDYLCVRCRCNPRQRALMHVLEQVRSDWRQCDVYEPSGSGPASERLAREVRGYVRSHYYPDVAPGSFVAGVRVEDLGALTFPDRSFDVVVTQDVLEHVFDLDAAVREIARVLRPGGMHVFTTPVFADLPSTRFRAALDKAGIVQHLHPAEFHGDPVSDGVLVVQDWGTDVCSVLDRTGVTSTSLTVVEDKRLGLAGPFLDVGVSRRL